MEERRGHEAGVEQQGAPSTRFTMPTIFTSEPTQDLGFSSLLSRERAAVSGRNLHTGPTVLYGIATGLIAALLLTLVAEKGLGVAFGAAT